MSKCKYIGNITDSIFKKEEEYYFIHYKNDNKYPYAVYSNLEKDIKEWYNKEDFNNFFEIIEK